MSPLPFGFVLSHLLCNRHPDLGPAGGLPGRLEKKRAACEEAAALGNPLLQFTAEPDKGPHRMTREFIREIRGERPPICPAADAVPATQIWLTGAKSISKAALSKWPRSLS